MFLFQIFKTDWGEYYVSITWCLSCINNVYLSCTCTTWASICAWVILCVWCRRVSYLHYMFPASFCIRKFCMAIISIVTNPGNCIPNHSLSFCDSFDMILIIKLVRYLVFLTARAILWFLRLDKCFELLLHGKLQIMVLNILSFLCWIYNIAWRKWIV